MPDPSDPETSSIPSFNDWLNSVQLARLNDAIKRSLQPTELLGMNPSAVAAVLSDRVSRDVSANNLRVSQWLASYFGKTLSKSRDYEEIDRGKSSYSTELKSAADYFAKDEEVVESFDGLHRAITTLIKKNGNLQLVWRGVRDASWGFHSSLYRHLMNVNGVQEPSKSPVGAQPFPDEDQMVRAEVEMLRIARDVWRLDGHPALEIFARLQHYGAPTRLVDVTRNPYIGAWFAIEEDDKTEHSDARLFALATHPVARPEDAPFPDISVRLDDVGGLRDPFWHGLIDSSTRQTADWGTGAKRRIWIPPNYEQRIVAQNAAFVLDGVPMVSESTASYFTKPNGGYWRKADLLAAGSIYVKTSGPTRKARVNRPNLAPTFSFRITAEAKREIRQVLESRFSYNHATIYPDIAGLSQYLRQTDFLSRSPGDSQRKAEHLRSNDQNLWMVLGPVT